MNAVGLVNRPDSAPSRIRKFILHIFNLRRQVVDGMVCRIYREANQRADQLAKEGVSLVWFTGNGPLTWGVWFFPVGFFFLFYLWLCFAWILFSVLGSVCKFAGIFGLELGLSVLVCVFLVSAPRVFVCMPQWSGVGAGVWSNCCAGVRVLGLCIVLFLYLSNKCFTLFAYSFNSAVQKKKKKKTWYSWTFSKIIKCFFFFFKNKN